MDNTELEHLSPTFDPNSVTVPRLRAILVAHDVTYPASSKKPQLIELFNTHVAPQAKRILSSRGRTKPSSQGITNANARGESSPPPASVEETPRRSSRRTTSHEPDAVRSGTSARSSVTASAQRESVDSRRTPASDSESTRTARSDVRRRTRHSIVSSAIKEEEPETPMLDGTNDQESPFTTDNPFQGGSSPLLNPVAQDDYRRRTTGSRPSGARKGIPAPTRTSNNTAKTKQDSLQQVKREVALPSDTDDSSEAGEEFTPEEQLDLEQEQFESGDTVLMPPRSRKVGRRANSAVRSAPWAILLAVLGGLATVWRQEKLNVGYCGVGRPSTSLGGVEIPEWARFLQPECEPCPQHAYCFGNLKTMCEPGFILEPHPMSVGGAIPLPPSCEPDGEKARKVKAVADRAVGELRERNAKWECGELRDEHGHRASNPEFGEQELKAQVSSKRRRGMSQDEFEQLWLGALGEIIGRDEVASGVDGRSGSRNLRSNSLARIPFGCAVRRSLRLALARHLWKLVALVAVLGSGAYARYSITSGRSMEQQAKQLASVALDRLATQATLSLHEPDRIPEAYISMSQLRDDILRNEFSSRKRQKLWDKVQAKVENNSNVRPMVREGRTGEVSRVWEWIGAVGAIEDTTGTSPRRDSGRFVRDVGTDSSPLGRVGAGETKQDVIERRRWDEGRPIY